MRYGLRNRFIVCLCVMIWIIPVFANTEYSESDPVVTSLSIPLNWGYSIDWSREEVVSSNVKGVMNLSLYQSGYADLSIVYYDVEIEAGTYTSKSAISKEIFSYPDGYSDVRLGISDSKNRIFTSLYPFENESVYICSSCVINDIVYTGFTILHSKDLSMEERSSLLSIHESSSIIRYDADELPDNYERGVRRSSPPIASSLETQSEGIRSSESKIFFLAHYNSKLNNYREGYREYQNYSVLENSYCTDFLEDDDPTISEIQTQLIQCCSQYSGNKLGVYHLAFHGGVTLNGDDSYSRFKVNGGWIMPDDFSSCWSLPYTVPDDAIIIAMCCKSLNDTWYEETTQYNPDTMSEAFLDVEYYGTQFGAASYIGSIPNLGGNQDIDNSKARHNGGIAMLLECLARCDMSVEDSVRFVSDRNLVKSDNFTYRIREDLSDPIYLSNDDETEPSFFEDWQYYKEQTIEQADGAGENYPIEIRVHYDNGTDSATQVYLQNGDEIPHCQVAFDDIRFTASDKVTPLNHWRESYTSSDEALFWVEAKDNLDDNQTIYIYYGNELASTASDGYATFLFFDDFESVSLGEHPDSERWTVYGAEDASDYTAVEGDPAGGTNQVLRCKQGGDGDWNYARSIDINVTHGVTIGFKWRRDACYYHSYQSAMDMDGHYMWTARYYAASPRRIMFYDGTSYQNLSPNFYWSANTWYSTEIQTVSTMLNYTDCSDGDESIGDLRASPYAGLQWFHSFADYKNAAHSGYSDDYYVRKFIEDEPEHGEWSNEESLY